MDIGAVYLLVAGLIALIVAVPWLIEATGCTGHGGDAASKPPGRWLR